MPKVKQEYFGQKRNEILSAALTVCRAKPLYQITMKDIIRESGISQGGIYRYFKSVDEILTEVINRCNPDLDCREKVDLAVRTGKSRSEAVSSVLSLLADYMNSHTDTLGKFHFELNILIANQPERMKSISENNIHIQMTQYFMQQLYSVIKSGADAGEFRPLLPLDDIFGHLSSSIDGIVLDGVLHKCYGLPEPVFGYDLTRRMQALIKSTLLLLNPFC